ncbi:hypothetical protein IQ07DRAFT_69963 [Pyrenochaeta sp. DS3sAY3a]|nr:hypothetical protein IQ07DRAFT_69963 [Pyrenochaeta sp. DS3sAY3a]
MTGQYVYKGMSVELKSFFFLNEKRILFRRTGKPPKYKEKRSRDGLAQLQIWTDREDLDNDSNRHLEIRVSILTPNQLIILQVTDNIQTPPESSSRLEESSSKIISLQDYESRKLDMTIIDITEGLPLVLKSHKKHRNDKVADGKLVRYDVVRLHLKKRSDTKFIWESIQKLQARWSALNPRDSLGVRLPHQLLARSQPIHGSIARTTTL